MGLLRHWPVRSVYIHDDLQGIGHWLKEVLSWSWWYELSSSNYIMLSESGDCSRLRYRWSCSTGTAQSLFMTKWDLYQGSIGRSGDVTSSCHCCVIYGWVWGQNIMIVCHWWYVVQFIAFPRGLELLPCIIEFEDFIYSCKTWDFADWSRVVISFDRRVRPSSKHYTPASLWIVYFYVHLAEDWSLRVESKSLRTSV